MKKVLTTLIILISIQINAQEQYWYASLGFDPNQSFNIIDNPRMEDDVKGLDWNLEAGRRDGSTGFYISYGEFKAGGFKNYKVGVNYYIDIINNLETSIGGGIGAYKKRFMTGLNFEREAWENVGWYHLRARIVWFITDHIGLGAKAQLQHRTLVKGNHVVEGYISLVFKL